MGVFSAKRPASSHASGSVGWAWIVSVRQSTVSSLAIASAISAMREAASWPTTCAPKIWPVF